MFFAIHGQAFGHQHRIVCAPHNEICIFAFVAAEQLKIKLTDKYALAVRFSFVFCYFSSFVFFGRIHDFLWIAWAQHHTSSQLTLSLKASSIHTIWMTSKRIFAFFSIYKYIMVGSSALEKCGTNNGRNVSIHRENGLLC